MTKRIYIYSQLSSQSVREIVTANYDLSASVGCKFYVLGLHDNYLIEAGDQKYIFRIYRNDWRSEEEINFELDLLAFLGEKTFFVANPLQTRAGELSVYIDSPEGKRVGTLFHYADGFAPGNEITIEQSRLLGNTAAKLHRATESFQTSYNRHVLDTPYLLDESVHALATFIDKESHNFLKNLQRKIHSNIPSLSRTPGSYGICMGDINSTNFHINQQNHITLFDFDQCGFGYRAFDIGKFISSLSSLKSKHDLAKAFIGGYQQVRQLNQDEIDAIPYFEMVSVIWVMAIHTSNADRIGHKWLEKPFWDRRLAKLKDLEKDL